jgi:hypothetical protein
MRSGHDNTVQAPLREQLVVHAKWRSRATRAVHDMRAWLRSVGAGTPQTDARLRRALAAIEGDRLCIAIAGESQRGKTELMNALFFAELRQLLPIAATGSLCPLEICWQPSDGGACLKLLPIEYLGKPDSLAGMKQKPERWVRLPLHPQEPEQISAILAEVHRTKPLQLAQAAGLAGAAATGDQEGTVEIPCWRYAVLSFPHPLLKRGLVLLDLPGRAAMARDPALYTELLAAIDGMVMTIAAERGVEAGDLALWREHLRPAGVQAPVTLVALTRSGALGAVEEAPSGSTLERLRHRTATTLGIDRALVRAVCARAGLAAKIADKPARLRASGIDALESLLAEQVIAKRRQACRSGVEASIGALLRFAMSRLEARTAATEQRMAELEVLDAQSAGLVARSLELVRRDEALYVQGVEQVRGAQRLLRAHAEHARGLLCAAAFEHLAGRASARLAERWTTAGMRQTMRALFDELRGVVARVGTDSARLGREVQDIYAALRAELGLELDPPAPFSLTHYRHEMELLYAEAVRWIDSEELLLCPRGAAVARFERGLVQRARVLFDHLRDAVDGWLDAALAPPVRAVEARKARAEARLGRYQRVETSREHLHAERASLVRERAQLARQLTLLRNIRNAIDFEPGPQAPARRAPYLVTSDGAPVRRLDRATEA